MMKRICIILVMILCKVVAFSQTNQVDGITYLFDESKKTAEVRFNFDMEYSGEIVIPEEVVFNGVSYIVTSIGKEAFCDCKSLTSLILPNTISKIDEKAFYHCSNLVSILIPENTETIGELAFAGVSKLKSIIFPPKVKGIYENAFNGCDGLTSITFEGFIEQIRDDAFSYLPALENVYINDLAGYCNTELFTPFSSPLHNTKKMFCNGQEIVDLIIPENTKYVFAWCFRDCDFLNSVVIPNTIEEIGMGAFRDCDNLKVLVLGENVNRYCDYSFYDCNSLTDVYSYSKEVPLRPGYKMFGDPVYDKATLHVPAESIDKYKSSNFWEKFKNIVAINENDIKPTDISCKSIDDDEIESIFSIAGIKEKKQKKGMNIVKFKSGKVKKMIVK